MNINLLDTSDSTLEPVGFCQHYQILDDAEKAVMDSYLLLNVAQNNISEQQIKEKIETHIKDVGGIKKFPTLSELNDFLESAIVECRDSDNEMYFVDWNDESVGYFSLKEVADSIEQWHLDRVVILNDIDRGDGEPMLTVYGGAIELINFIDE